MYKDILLSVTMKILILSCAEKNRDNDKHYIYSLAREESRRKKIIILFRQAKNDFGMTNFETEKALRGDLNSGCRPCSCVFVSPTHGPNYGRQLQRGCCRYHKDEGR